MHKYLFLFLFFFGCASEPTVSNTNLTIEQLQKAAMKQYMDSPVQALPMMEKLAGKYAQNKNHVEASETYFNIATIYDQTLNEKEKAISFSQKSLSEATLSKDQKQEANLLQHIGYLKGLTGKTKEGKKDIVDAIMKYKLVNDEKGVAKAQFNLSRVFYMEGALDESAHFLSKSMAHLRSIKDSENIFHNNLFAISLFKKMGNSKLLKEAINENKSLISSIKYEGAIKHEFEQLLNGIED